MRFSFPHPSDGWRAFFGEVGIIVLGVLIALGAGQLVDTWQWRQQVKQADEVFQGEMDAATSNAYMQLAVGPCLKVQLREIAAKLNQPAGNWRGMAEQQRTRGPSVPIPAEAISIPYRGSNSFAQLTTEAWSNALASGTVNHLSFVRTVMLSRAYAAARQLWMMSAKSERP